MSPATIVIAPANADLATATSDILTAYWHPDFTRPRIFTLATNDSALVASAARGLSRVASQQGVLAPVMELGTSAAVFEPVCKHRIGVFDLPLDPEFPATNVLFAINPWTRLASRKRRLAMRISPQLDLDIVINAERVNPVLTIQVGRFGSAEFALICSDIVAAEVIGRAMRAVAAPQDWDGTSPWQTPIVQHAIERSMGVRHGGQISFNIKLASETDETSDLY